jgi:hypothetical protein
MFSPLTKSFVGSRVPIGSLIAPVLPSLCSPNYTLKMDLANFSDSSDKLYIVMSQNTANYSPRQGIPCIYALKVLKISILLFLHKNGTALTRSRIISLARVYEFKQMQILIPLTKYCSLTQEYKKITALGRGVSYICNDSNCTTLIRMYNISRPRAITRDQGFNSTCCHVLP